MEEPVKEEATFEGYCILEIMGRRRLAGFVREVTIAGAGFLRIDVPGPDDTTAMTAYYPPASVYALTPTTEAIARAVAQRNPEGPVTRWELPPPPVVEARRIIPGEMPPEAYQEHDEEFEYDDADDDERGF
jgi:hypothetical protein